MLKGVLKKRYLADSIEELASNVSSCVGKTSSFRGIYHDLILKKMFIPAGNTLLAGKAPIRPNCCILPTVSDENLSETVERAAKLWQDRIGIGFDLSQLSDPVSGLKLLSSVNQSIDLVHRPKRGNMGVLNIKHPRILEFVECKNEGDSLYNFNISVGLSSLDILKGGDIISSITRSAWKSGDPGILFLDRIGKIPDEKGNGESISVPALGKCTTVVPCGEQSMFPNEVCTLGSMNLASSDFWVDKQFKEDTFEEAISYAVRFLDDVVDLMDINDPILKDMSLRTRRIGLGIMGFADVLQKLGIPYGSEDCLKLVDYFGHMFKRTAHQSSIKLAEERGVCPALKEVGIKRRNLTVTCIAPTGGITLVAQNSAFAVEPLFSEANGLDIKKHLQVMSNWQKYVCNSISKTINLKNTVSVEDVYQVWREAVNSNVKSVTVYRDGSKNGQPMAVGCKSGNCEM